MRRQQRFLVLVIGILIGSSDVTQGQNAPQPGQNANPMPWVLRPQNSNTQTQATTERTAAQPGPEAIFAQVLATHPATAMYPITTSVEGGRVVIRGVVGTKLAYDAVVQMAIASGLPFRDHLVIDTAAAHAAADAAIAIGAAAGPAFPFDPNVSLASGPVPYPPTYGQYSPQPGVVPPYVYPQPLFGRIDEPFFGLEPPLISYPPWWGALSARRLGDLAREEAAAAALRGQGGMGFPLPGVQGQGAQPGNLAESQPLANNPPPQGVEDLPRTVEMTIDGRGVATLRGTVPSLTDRIEIGQYLAQEPGISQVINLLNVAPPNANPNPNPNPNPNFPPGDPANIVTPPPPPQPQPPPPPRDGGDNPGQVNQQQPERPIDFVQQVEAFPQDEPREIDPLAEALAGQPELDGLPIFASFRDGIVTLTGDVPTVLEAMLAYRAIEQVDGVEQVIDQLRFKVPDGQGKNPLREADSLEDVEAYLLAQLRRQLGDQAKLDRVRVLGNRLEIRGTLSHPDDRPRIEAVLRSTPLLRGFDLAPRLATANSH